MMDLEDVLRMTQTRDSSRRLTEHDRRMSAMGFSVDIEQGRPVVRGVILDDSGTEVGEIQHLTDMRYDVRTQLDELGKAFETTLVGQRPEVMVIRLGRIHIWDSRKSTATRARAEGVLLATSRDNEVHVLAMDADEVSRAIGGDRSSVDKAVRAWATKTFVEAGAAALAAHSIAKRGELST
jgi:Holliday junction resolvasome RuvABC endonuclease subunit